MERRIVGIVSLAVGIIFILLSFATSTVINLQEPNLLDHIITAFLLAWMISSLLVKVGMIFNRKKSMINIGSLVLFGCWVLLMLFVEDKTSVDARALTWIFGLLLIIGWPIVDLYDFELEE